MTETMIGSVTLGILAILGVHDTLQGHFAEERTGEPRVSAAQKIPADFESPRAERSRHGDQCA